MRGTQYNHYDTQYTVATCSKGDLDNAVKCLELYVGVAEGGASKEAVAKACSAAGIMFNKLVST